MGQPEFLTPDWVMIGIPQSDGTVCLMASKELTRAELVAERDWEGAIGSLSDYYAYLPEMQYRVTAEMKTFVLIIAADYTAAFRSLFEQWTPEPARRRQLPPTPRALPGPR